MKSRSWRIYLENRLRKFLLWRFRHIPTRHFVWLMAIVVGMIAGMAVVTLKGLVWSLHYALEHYVNSTIRSYFFFLFPIVGISLAYAYQRWMAGGRLPHGVVELLYRIQHDKGRIPSRNLYVHMIGSGLTVGFGGSVGLEAPIVATGGAWGANLAQLFRLGVRNRVLLLACGTAAAASGIFNAPITGVLFTLEVLMIALPPLGLVPLLLSSVTAIFTTRIFLGDVVLFNFSHIDPVRFSDLPLYLLMGAVSGIGAVYFKRTIVAIEQWFDRRSIRTRLVLGGLTLGMLILLFPPLYGEGYHAVKHVLGIHPMPSLSGFWLISENRWAVAGMLFWLGAVLLRPISAGITLGAGGTGGIFAPVLFSGAILGYVTAQTIEWASLVSSPTPTNNLALVGMAGTLSALLNAPLTAIFLIAEITRGYQLLLPLILTSAIAYATYSLFEQNSLYRHIFLEELRRKGRPLMDAEHRILASIKIEPLIEKDFVTVPLHGYLADLVNAVKQSHRHTFPVIDEKGRLQGVVDLDDIREIMFNPEQWESLKITEIMHLPPAIIYKDDPAARAMELFDQTRAWIIPVIDAEGHYIGFISRSRFFNVFRRRLQKQ